MNTQTDVESPRSDTVVVGRRIVQFIIDWLVLVIVSGALLALFLLSPTEDDGAVDPSASGFWIIAAVVTVGNILWWLYVWVLRPYGHDGRTIGMGVMSLQVVGVDGTPASRGQLFVRALLLAVDVGFSPFVGLIAMLVTRKNQRVGDLAARTIVRRA